MDFEYNISEDYCKIAKKVDEYDLRKECLEKLKELDIKRVGEILALSEFVISTYKENSKWIREAKDYFISKEGELGIWKAIEYAQSQGKSGEKELKMYQCIVEDAPLDIIENIILGTLHMYVSEYACKTCRGLKLRELNLPDELRKKLDNTEISTEFFVLSARKLCEYTKFTLNVDDIGEIRKKIAERMALPEGIFEFLDEVDAKQEQYFEEYLKIN